MDSKRRRVENDYNYVASTGSTSRTKALAALGRGTETASRANSNTGSATRHENAVHSPLLSLSTLPPASLQRYLSRYGLLEAQGSLSYHHAVFPVPALPAVLASPLVGRSLIVRRSSKPRIDPVLNGEELGVAPTEGDASNEVQMEKAQLVDEVVPATTGRGRKRVWQEPKTPDFANLSAYDDPQIVVDRLAARAKTHWDKRDSVKEGETLTNFVFALRMRAHTLRATPPG